MPALRRWLTRDARLIGRVGGFSLWHFSAWCGQHLQAWQIESVHPSLPPSAHFAATSVTTFALRDMADSRRFVMTFCYDLPVLEVKNLTKPFIYKAWSG
jgi:hypothetical protein